MRRLIAYFALTGAMILGVGAATVPTILNLNADLAYQNGRTLYFKVSHFDEESLNGNYGYGYHGEGDVASFLTEEDKNTTDGEYIVEKIANEMRKRLDVWEISEAEVETQGYDTIRVSFRASTDTDTEYNRISDYLSFSGGDYELDAENTTAEGDNAYEHNVAWETMLDGKTASVRLLDMDHYQVPVVTIPIASADKDALLDLISYCNEHRVEEVKDDEGNVTTPAESCNLVIWANRVEGDTSEEAKKDTNVEAKIFYQHDPKEEGGISQCLYYEDNDKAEDKREHPYLQLIPNSAATSSGTYDPTKAQEASDAAYYLMRKFNAAPYVYDDDAAGWGADSKFSVSFAYSEIAYASVDPLLSYGWNLTPSMGPTMIALLVSAALLCVVLAVFERLFALQHVGVMAVTTFATFATYVALGSQFNIAALIGLAAVAVGSLFGGIYYTSRLKDEIYKGRTLKKAHQEAAKKSMWPSIDAGIVMLLLGVCLYLLGGAVAKQAGVMLTLGGIFAVAANLILTRLAGWMLTSDSYMQTAYPKLLGVSSERIPDLMKEEKQTYFGPYQDKKFSGFKKPAYIASGALFAVGLAFCIVFGVKDGANIYNDAAYRKTSTVLRIEVQSTQANGISIEHFADKASIYDPEGAANTETGTAPTDILHQYTVDGKNFASYVSGIELSSSPKSVYLSPEWGEGTTVYYFFYEVSLKKSFDLETTHTFTKWEGAGYVAQDWTYFHEMAADIEEINTNHAVAVSFGTVTPESLPPYVGDIALGLGIGLSACLLYLMIRFRPSRGVAITLISAAATFFALTFFVYTRISVTPVVALGTIYVAAFALVSALFLLNRQKELFKENHDREISDREKRDLSLESATSYEAGSYLLYTGLALYVPVAFFAFGPAVYGSPYLLSVLGVVFAAALILFTLSPMSARFASWLSHIKIRKPHFKKKEGKGSKPQGGNLMRRKKGAEPEEAIFIGIND